MDEAKFEMKSCCDLLWRELLELQAQLNCTPAAPEHATSSNTVLQERERHLKAEIQLLSESLTNSDFTLPTNSLLLRELVRKDLEPDSEKLEQLLSLLQFNCEQLRQDTENEKNVHESLMLLHSSLEKNIAEEKAKDTSSSQPESLLKVLEVNTKLEKLYATRARQMISFVQQHFPAPTKEQLRGWNMKHGKSGSKVVSVQSLQSILEILMNKCIETPSDAYIVTDDTFWPPYIEMMLRYGIVQRHPQNEAQIKLTAYHL